MWAKDAPPIYSGNLELTTMNDLPLLAIDWTLVWAYTVTGLIVIELVALASAVQKYIAAKADKEAAEEELKRVNFELYRERKRLELLNTKFERLR